MADVFSVTYGRRSYSPDLGRWINRDPIGKQGGRNIYLFVKNIPTTDWDNFGLIPGKAAIINWAINFTLKRVNDLAIRVGINTVGQSTTMEPPIIRLTVDVVCSGDKRKYLVYEVEKRTKTQVSAYKIPLGVGRFTMSYPLSHSIAQFYACGCEEPEWLEKEDTDKTDWIYFMRYSGIPMWKRNIIKTKEKIALNYIGFEYVISPESYRNVL